MNDIIRLPPKNRDIPKIFSRLLRYSYDVFLVGGCVRDSLMGIEPHDWDFCTSAKPETVESIFGKYDDCKIVETGIKHGTVTLVFDGGSYEITTYRIDGEYTDGRRPDHVEFTGSIIEDLSRRDFTMNAIAYSPFSGFVDPFGGREDIKNRLIRCVGNPTDRFGEDALRILRAIRFASTFCFRVNKDTDEAIHAQKDLLKNISAERIRSELQKLLMGDVCSGTLIEYNDVITTVIPELAPCVGFDQNNRFHCFNIYDHIAYATGVSFTKDPVVKWALLLHDIGKPQCYTEDERGGHFYGHAEPSAELAKQVMDRLKFDNQSKHDIEELVRYHDETIEPNYRAVRRMLNKIGEQQFFRLMEVRRADITAHAPGTQYSRFLRREQVEAIAKQIIAERQCFSLKDLAINGDDVIGLGIPGGRRVGEVLKSALEAVLDGRVENEKNSLLSYIQTIKTETDGGEE